jgi:hypothetical protein
MGHSRVVARLPLRSNLAVWVGTSSSSLPRIVVRQFCYGCFRVGVCLNEIPTQRLDHERDSNPGLTNPNVRGHGLVLDIKHAPEATGTIRKGVAAPHSCATVPSFG